MLGSAKTVLLDVRNQVLELIDQEAGDAYQACDADGDEAETGFTEIEAVDGPINKRKGFEEGVVDSVCE